jgi:capsular polysaccharide transport system permease protein
MQCSTGIQKAKATADKQLKDQRIMEVLRIPRGSPPLDDAIASDEPRIRPRRLWKPDWLFLAVVVAPFVAATIYFGFIATPVYISESSFVVRLPQKAQPSLLGGILQGVGFTPSTEELYAAQSFDVSRDALRALNKNGAVEKAYTRPGIFFLERFNPFGVAGRFEDLFAYFQNKVAVKEDASTSITTLSVRAFDARDAQRFNEQLLEMSEQTVNRMNERGQNDLVRYAENEVANAKAKAQAAGLALASYQQQSGVVDPVKQADVQMQMVSKLQDQLIASKTELAQLVEYTPLNPRIPSVRTQIGVLQNQIEAQLGKVTSGNKSLAHSGVAYQRLMLENEFANKQLEAALASLEQARAEAQRKQAYVERIVQPNLPDAPMEPRRLRAILATLALSLLAYGVLRMLTAGIREHAQ